METESTPVVPANQLLEVAGVLSEGAARLHRQLSTLPPEERRALLEVVVGQVGDIVQAWSQLVRAVVPTGPTEPTEFARPKAPAEAAPAQTQGRPLGPTFAEGPPASPAPIHPETRRQTPSSATSSSAPRVPVSPLSSGANQRSATVAPLARPAENEDDRLHAHLGPRPMPEASSEAALTRDELTGVLNRSAGFAALNREVERCQRERERFILGYLNVDGLQHVNETQGPRAGDDLLRKVAAALRATLRSYDVVLRLAGDEFLFSMPGADANAAAQRVQDFTVILGQEAPGASVSVGFAELRDGDTLDELVVRADDDLVEARRRRARPRLR